MKEGLIYNRVAFKKQKYKIKAMEVQKSEKSLANSRVYEELRKEEFIDIEFIVQTPLSQLIEKNWPFMHYLYTFRKTDTFLIIEDKIKEIHGPINNLEIHYDPSMNGK